MNLADAFHKDSGSNEIYICISGDNDPCTPFNGGCSHSCHPAPDGQAECRCPEEDGVTYILGNGGKMCIPSNHTCKSNRFVCGNGQCLSYKWVCDSDPDCSDGFDENENMCGKCGYG